jgi:lipoyl(octanoyl) transferase
VAQSQQQSYLSPMTVLAIPTLRTLPGLSPYREALARMEDHVAQMLAGRAEEEIWLVEHPPTLTAGTSAVASDLLDTCRFPVVATGRGGRHTYHGPGQRVVYPMLNLDARGRDVRRYVSALEQWVIAALATLAVPAATNAAGTGIWVETDGGLAKIAAIGVRVRRWISFHGLAVNVETDLRHYEAIVPCGIREHGVTRLADLVPQATMAMLDNALAATLPQMLHSLSVPQGLLMKTLETARDTR